MRALIALFLGLVLAVSSVTAAVARAEMAGAVEMVVCAGEGTGTVTLDPSGQPVMAHHCPDCTAAQAALAGPVVPGAERPVTRGEGLGLASLPDVADGLRVAPVARGPPAGM